MTNRLEAARHQRVQTAIADREIQALVLGRQDNVGYATGMRRLWTSGTRPFGAGCVLIGTTGRAHLLSSWDSGVPESVPFDDLYPLTWSPEIMGSAMKAIEGLPTAHRIGVDTCSPGFIRAASRFAPEAEIVPCDDLMADVRSIKLEEEIELIRRACQVAWSGVEAVLEQPKQELPLSRSLTATANQGVTIPSSKPVVRFDGNATIVDIGVIADLYEGGVGGRFVDGHREETSHLVSACRHGATHDDLADSATGRWLVRGLGMGYETPILDPTRGRDHTLRTGMVLSVTDGDLRDVVAVREGQPDVLSAKSPAGAGS
ncbi:MAG: aminopeptidase P family N-terminal domain-containing protein [Actinomycetota bacterium]|nr:aminopeptidase P family N-terminal domain-containing protein [Actinomycetota bacterium]